MTRNYHHVFAWENVLAINENSISHKKTRALDVHCVELEVLENPGAASFDNVDVLNHPIGFAEFLDPQLQLIEHVRGDSIVQTFQDEQVDPLVIIHDTPSYGTILILIFLDDRVLGPRLDDLHELFAKILSQYEPLLGPLSWRLPLIVVLG